MNIVLLQAAGGGGFRGTLPMILLVFVVMYFFMIRPQAKRQKEERKFREEISKGMRVVTNSGIHGKLLEVGDTYIILESENSRLKLDKSAISKELSAQYLPKSDPKEKDKDKEKDKK